jgi:hypothetical protein
MTRPSFTEIPLYSTLSLASPFGKRTDKGGLPKFFFYVLVKFIEWRERHAESSFLEGESSVLFVLVVSLLLQ